MISDAQVDALQIVLSNPVIMGALRQVFSETLAVSLPVVKDADNAVIGEKYRAYHDATNIVWGAFSKLESYEKRDTRTSDNTRHI